jgi:D-alanyl-D-alanine dipeptidase
MQKQITKTLPRSEWQDVNINENNEPLVEIRETERIKIGLVTKEYEPSISVRKSVAEKLYNIPGMLPKDVNIVLVEGYRSIKSQQESWDKIFEKLKKENPELDEEQIEKQVRLIIAKPDPLANHNCGGAVDILLSYSDGTTVDMGVPYPIGIPYSNQPMDEEYYSKFPMFSEDITEEQKENRKMLREAMESQDFVWYPGEWWHYSYGDRMWAVYTEQKECFYGPIEQK